jgi:hypothetical protein
MERCPICRALLNGADTCRRCRSELAKVREVERRGKELAGAAMHRLVLGDVAEAVRLLRRARAIHATREVRMLSRIVRAPFPAEKRDGEAVVTDVSG